jgi:hypothetical protein
VTHRGAGESGGDRRELRAWRAAYLGSLPDRSGPCPSEEQLAELLLGETAAERRAVLGDHLVACRSCAEAYRTLAELDAAASARSRAADGRRRAIFGWAAAAAVLVGGSALMFDLSRARGGAVRGVREARVGIEPPHGAELREPPRRLAWTAREGAVSYRVVLFDAESTPLWESEPTSATEVALPEAARAQLAHGGVFYWRVRSSGESGPRAGPLHRFEIVR